MGLRRALEGDFFAPFYDFWGGLTRTSPGSWLGVLLFMVAEFAACTLFATPRRLAKVDPHYLMEFRGDEYALVTWRLFSIRMSKKKTPQVVYMGMSQATRALATRDEAKLGAEISARSQMGVVFHALSTNNQSYHDSLAILDQLPRSFCGAVVLVVNDYKDEYNMKAGGLAKIRRRIAFIDAPTLQPLEREEGYDPFLTGNYFIDHLDFFAARRIAALRLSALREPGLGSFDPPRLEQFIDKLRRERRRLSHESDVAYRERKLRVPMLTGSKKVIVKLLETARSRGIPLAFVESPQLPERQDVYAERIESFHEGLDELAAAYDAVFWHIGTEMELTNADFQDENHLGNREKRREFQHRMMANLAELLTARRDQAEAEGHPWDTRPRPGSKPSPEPDAAEPLPEGPPELRPQEE